MMNGWFKRNSPINLDTWFHSKYIHLFIHPLLNDTYSPSHLGYAHFSSVTQLYPTLRNPMDCSTPGFPVHHQLPEVTQTHVHRVSDAIQPSHPVSSPSPPAFNLSQHQGLMRSLPMSWFFASGGQITFSFNV